MHSCLLHIFMLSDGAPMYSTSPMEHAFPCHAVALAKEDCVLHIFMPPSTPGYLQCSQPLRPPMYSRPPAPLRWSVPPTRSTCSCLRCRRKPPVPPDTSGNLRSPQPPINPRPPGTHSITNPPQLVPGLVAPTCHADLSSRSLGVG